MQQPNQNKNKSSNINWAAKPQEGQFGPANLNNLYQDTLGRSIGQEGRDYYGEKVASGAMSKEDVLWDLKQSDEYRKRQNPVPNGSPSNGNNAQSGGMMSQAQNQDLPRVTQGGGEAPSAPKQSISQKEWTPVDGTQPPEPRQADRRNYSPSTGNSAGYSANTQQVQAPQTVQGQMTGLLSQGSRYLDIARQNAAEQANSRGLLNSTMAAGAGERAAIQAAMPIAQQDASTYANQSLTNQQAINQARQFSTGNEQQMNLANMDSTNRARQFNATADMNTSQFNTTQSNNMAQNQWSQMAAQKHEQVMKNLDTESRAQLIDLESQWNQMISRDKSASNAYMQAMDSLSRVLGNSKLSPEQQKKASQEITGKLGSYFNLLNTLDEGEGYGAVTGDNASQGSNEQSSTDNNNDELTSKIADLEAQIQSLRNQGGRTVNRWENFNH